MHDYFHLLQQHQASEIVFDAAEKATCEFTKRYGGKVLLSAVIPWYAFGPTVGFAADYIESKSKGFAEVATAERPENDAFHIMALNTSATATVGTSGSTLWDIPLVYQYTRLDAETFKIEMPSIPHSALEKLQIKFADFN